MDLSTYQPGGAALTTDASTAAFLANLAVKDNSFEMTEKMQENQAYAASQNQKAIIEGAQEQAKGTRMDGFKGAITSAVTGIGAIGGVAYQSSKGTTLAMQNQSIQNAVAFQQEFSKVKVESLTVGDVDTLANFNPSTKCDEQKMGRIMNVMNNDNVSQEEQVAAFQDLSRNEMSTYAAEAKRRLLGLNDMTPGQLDEFCTKLKNNPKFAENYVQNGKNKFADANKNVDNFRETVSREISKGTNEQRVFGELLQSGFNALSGLAGSPEDFMKATHEYLQGVESALSTLYQLMTQNVQGFIQAMLSVAANAQEAMSASVRTQKEITDTSTR